MSKRVMGPEGYVQDTILDYLRAERILAYRMQSGAVMVDKRMVRFGVPGMADILAFPRIGARPAPLWIECKSETGRQSALQVSFADQVERDGHHYMVARSVDDVIAYLQDLL